MQEERRLILKRDSDTHGALAEFHVYVDKKNYGNLAYGKTKIVPIDSSNHIVEVQGIFSDGIVKSKEYQVPAGEKDILYFVSQHMRMFVLEIVLHKAL